MDGEDFREEALLAAVKPLKAEDSTRPEAKPVRFGRISALDSVADASSLEAMFQRHHDRVFRTAYRVTGNAADAEDMSQTNAGLPPVPVRQTLFSTLTPYTDSIIQMC